MNDKRILITGAGGGLGSLLSKYLLENGFKVAWHTRQPLAIPAQLTEYKDHILPISGHLTNEHDVETMVAKVKQEWGSLDGLIHLAGTNISGMSWKLRLPAWQKALDDNLTSAFLISRAVSPLMRQQNHGRMIFFSSVVAKLPPVGTVAYAASKAGLLGLMRSLAKELAPHQVAVNAINLGYFGAGMLYDIDPAIREQIKASIPLGRFGQPEEIHALVAYLLSPQGGYLTGQELNLNGGLYG
jgi:NAD(P)-dependent dehydrogenase (short-subunit alcohol dehydrogenase family)